MTYYADLGADAARVSSDLITKLVALSLAAAVAGGIIPDAQAKARAELAATVKAIPTEDRAAAIQSATAGGGSAVELQTALDAANGGSSNTLLIVGGCAIAALLLFGGRR